jgi:hypothetical protein
LDRKREFIENRDKQVQENKKDNTSSSKRREKANGNNAAN